MQKANLRKNGRKYNSQSFTKKLSTELRGAKVSNEDKFALYNGLELSL